jgi:hypothetical protein
MSEGPDFFDIVGKANRNLSGTEVGPEELLQSFHLYGHARRAEALDAMDNYLNAADTSDLPKFVRLSSLRRDLDQVHHRLRKAGR